MNTFFNSGKSSFAIFFAISIGLNLIYTNPTLAINCKKLYIGATKFIDFAPNTNNLTANDKKEMKLLIEKGLKSTVKQSIDLGIDYGIKKAGLDQQTSNLTTNITIGDNNNQNNGSSNNGLNVDKIIQDTLYNNNQVKQALKENNIKAEDIDIELIKKELNKSALTSNQKQTKSNQTTQVTALTGVKTSNGNQNITITYSGNINNSASDQDFIRNAILTQIPIEEKTQNKRICSLISESLQSVYQKPFVKYYLMFLSSIIIMLLLNLILGGSGLTNIVLFGILKRIKVFRIETQMQEVDKIV